MGISAPGIGSNLDINGIVSKLMQAESQPLAVLAKKEASYQAKLSAFGALSGSLGSLQSALGTLNNLSTFKGVIATSGDSSIFSASATSSASAGSYAVNITQLAQAQTISSAGQASTTATIGSGASTTLTFQFGTISGGTLASGTYNGAGFSPDPNRATGVVTIDNTNNSLQGIRDAINKANIGVTASIVSDGGTTPNHLVIKSNTTGVTSSMKISVAGDATLSNLLAHDPASTQNMTQSVAAQNAALTINGINVSSTTNTVSGAIEGVTLNLSKVGSTGVTVASDTGSVTAAVNGFVKAFNDVNSTIRQVTSYDAESKRAGVLLGDSSVRNIEAQLRKLMATPLSGGGNLTTLSQIGLSIDKTGTMTLDSTKLSKAMSSNMTDVAALFSSIGTTTDSLVKFDGSTSSSIAGTYPVFLTKLATQGNVTGSTAVAPSTTITAANKDLTVTVDGVAAAVSLAAGSYTPAALITQVQSTINGASAFSSAGIAVSVTLDGSGQMVITSNKYGSTSKVAVSGTAVTDLLGGTPTTNDGADVTGNIAGVTGTGSGQYLTGASGSNSAGLKLLITGGTEGVMRGSVTFSHGYAHDLNKLVEGFLGSSGVIGGRTDGINRSIKDIGKQNEVVKARLADTEARYRKQFNALDALVGKMNSTSSYLTQQLAQISNLSKQ